LGYDIFIPIALDFGILLWGMIFSLYFSLLWTLIFSLLSLWVLVFLPCLGYDVFVPIAFGFDFFCFFYFGS